ncbi:MAG: hypothetical protein MN733_32320 [Nitrososphaera sp.]|nr:hypothetical protein [Nitrososphaera sp.]
MEQDQFLSITYKVNKNRVLVKACLGASLIPISGAVWWVAQSQTLKLIMLILGVGLFSKFAPALKGLLRLGDTVTLTREGIVSQTMWQRKSATWKDIERIRIGANFWDGIYYSVFLRSGGSIVFTKLIENHLDLHSRIANKLSQDGVT